MLQACLNGRRPRDDHPAVPLTADELAAERRATAAPTTLWRPPPGD
jgi:uncharacterized protein (DUF849 family)